MNEPDKKVPDLTPPTKAAKAPKEPKAPKAEKAPKPPKDPNAPAKPRNPRTDYGYSPDSIIRVVEGKEAKYKNQRKEWFDSIVASNGRKVSDWEATRKDQKDPPRGWLRFFVQDGAVSLERPAVAPAAPTPTAGQSAA